MGGCKMEGRYKVGGKGQVGWEGVGGWVRGLGWASRELGARRGSQKIDDKDERGWMSWWPSWWCEVCVG